MGNATNILILLITINLMLFMTFPTEFDNLFTINQLSEIGFNITSNTTAPMYIDGDSNTTSDMLGAPTTSGFSGLAGIFDIIVFAYRFLTFLITLTFGAPMLMNSIAGMPWQISVLFGVLFAFAYIMALLEIRSGRST